MRMLMMITKQDSSECSASLELILLGPIARETRTKKDASP